MFPTGNLAAIESVENERKSRFGGSKSEDERGGLATLLKSGFDDESIDMGSDRADEMLA